MIELSKEMPDVPWWRVISSSLEPLPGGEEKLREEGGLEKAKRGEFFSDFRAWPLFKIMASDQLKLSGRVVIKEIGEVKLAAGVDVSYRGRSAVACCAVVDEKLELLDAKFESFIPQIPYVPTYLAFRELRGMLPASMKCDFDVVFVDGHGILHPRGLGEASHLGLLLEKPAIGVAKSLLVGEMRKSEVYLNGSLTGFHFQGGFISPGHLVDLRSAVEVARKFWVSGNQPFPLKLAHSLSKNFRS